MAACHCCNSDNKCCRGISASSRSMPLQFGEFSKGEKYKRQTAGAANLFQIVGTFFQLKLGQWCGGWLTIKVKGRSFRLFIIFICFIFFICGVIFFVLNLYKTVTKMNSFLNISKPKIEPIAHCVGCLFG